MSTRVDDDVLVRFAINIQKIKFGKNITKQEFFLHALRWSGRDSPASAEAYAQTHAICGTYPDFVLSYAHHLSEEYRKTKPENAPYRNVRSLRAAPKRGDQSSANVIDLNQRRGKRPHPSKGA